MSRKFAYGVDLGWVSQLEDRGIGWIDESGRSVDVIREVKRMGADAVRLRVFVNPPAESYWKKPDGVTCMLGYCDAQSVLRTARRAADAGMRLMIDFHYSDRFADPQYQFTPAAWKDDTDEGLVRHVYQHTKDVLTLLTENGIFPEWVQVGNEINPGIMLPRCSLEKNPKLLVACLNAGYDAVKDCHPDCQVVTHLAGVHDRSLCVPFLDTFFRLKGKTDILGFSYYPYWYQIEPDRAKLRECLLDFYERYQKPVMIAEVGGEETDEDGTYDIICASIEALREVPDEQGLGVFYWEPEVGADFLPDRYPLGAARKAGDRTLRFTGALTAYRAYQA